MSGGAPLPADAQCRAYIAELAGVIAVNAELIALNAEIGDDAGLEYQLRRLVAHVKAATATFRDLEALDRPRAGSEGE